METEKPQMSQYGAFALRAGLARLYARMRMHTPTRPRIHMHARTREHAHTNQYVILIALPQQQWYRERASVLRDTYIACLVFRYHLQTTYHPLNKMALSPRCSDVHSPSYTADIKGVWNYTSTHTCIVKVSCFIKHANSFNFTHTSLHAPCTS